MITFVESSKLIQAGTACGLEHNLDSTNSSVWSILFSAKQQHWIRNATNFTSSPFKFENLYKLGGTCILLTGLLTSKLCDRFRTTEGAGQVKRIKEEEDNR
jgi:hypothetical protein